MRGEGMGVTLALGDALHEDCAAMCRELMGLILNARGVAVPGDAPREGEVSGGRRGRDVLTRFGRVRAGGRRYCHNAQAKAGRFPADDAPGLVGGATPALAKRAVAFALKEPYGQAAASFARAHTKDVTPEVMKALPRIVAQQARAFARHGPAADAPAAACAVVMGDGTGAPMRPEELRGVKGRGEDGQARTREVKAGATFRMTPQPGAPEARARAPGSTRYNATPGRKDEFADDLRANFDRHNPIPPPVTLFISDGAKWLRDIRRTHFPFAVEILDFYHAAGHLAPLPDLAGLAPGERKNAFRKWRRWLKEGKAPQLVRRCEGMAAADPARKGEWDAALNDYRDNLDRMTYGDYLAKGWFIGSGVVEGGCKTLVCARFKQPGMRWTLNGAEALLPFRAAFYSGEYDQIWDYIIGGKHRVKAA